MRKKLEQKVREITGHPVERVSDFKSQVAASEVWKALTQREWKGERERKIERKRETGAQKMFQKRRTKILL